VLECEVDRVAGGLFLMARPWVVTRDEKGREPPTIAVGRRRARGDRGGARARRRTRQSATTAR